MSIISTRYLTIFIYYDLLIRFSYFKWFLWKFLPIFMRYSTSFYDVTVIRIFLPILTTISRISTKFSTIWFFDNFFMFQKLLVWLKTKFCSPPPPTSSKKHIIKFIFFTFLWDFEFQSFKRDSLAHCTEHKFHLIF